MQIFGLKNTNNVRGLGLGLGCQLQSANATGRNCHRLQPLTIVMFVFPPPTMNWDSTPSSHSLSTGNQTQATSQVRNTLKWELHSSGQEIPELLALSIILHC